MLGKKVCQEEIAIEAKMKNDDHWGLYKVLPSSLNWHYSSCKLRLELNPQLNANLVKTYSN